MNPFARKTTKKRAKQLMEGKSILFPDSEKNSTDNTQSVGSVGSVGSVEVTKDNKHLKEGMTKAVPPVSVIVERLKMQGVIGSKDVHYLKSEEDKKYLGFSDCYNDVVVVANKELSNNIVGEQAKHIAHSNRVLNKNIAQAGGGWHYFNDPIYKNIKPYIKDGVSDKEVQLFKNGHIPHIYASLDVLLLDNLKYYDRIINYATMVLLGFVDIGGERYNREEAQLGEVIQEFILTPTQLYINALHNPQFGKEAFYYAFAGMQEIGERLGVVESNNEEKGSFLENNWGLLNHHPNFKRFHELNAFRVGVNGFRSVYGLEDVHNDKLGQICKPYLRGSVGITDVQLKTLYAYVNELNKVHAQLYWALDACLFGFYKDKKLYGIFIFNDEFYIYTQRFSMKVSKDASGRITKDYISNTYECFIAEQILNPSIDAQIQWARYKLPIIHHLDRQILSDIVDNLMEDYKKVIAVKRPVMNDEQTHTKATFTGIFNNIRVKEEFFRLGSKVNETTKVFSRKNMVKYLIERGYYLFGTSDSIMEIVNPTEKSLVKHYSQYTITIYKKMEETILKTKKNQTIFEHFLLSGNLLRSPKPTPIYALDFEDNKLPLLIKKEQQTKVLQNKLNAYKTALFSMTQKIRKNEVDKQKEVSEQKPKTLYKLLNQK